MARRECSYRLLTFICHRLSAICSQEPRQEAEHGSKGYRVLDKSGVVINALLVTAVLLVLSNVVWGLDIQDINPAGPGMGTQKAFRGGGWMDSTTTMRAAMRNGTDPNTKINWLGFRCAKGIEDNVSMAAHERTGN